MGKIVKLLESTHASDLIWYLRTKFSYLGHWSTLKFMLLFTQLCPTFCDPQDCSKPGFLSFTISLSLLRLMSIVSMMLSNHLISHPTFSPSLNLCQHQGIYQLVGFLPISWLIASGGQSIGASVSASVLPMNTQDWFPLGLTGLNSFQSKGLSRVFSNTTVQKHQFFSAPVFMVQLSHLYMTSGKIIALTIWTFVGRVVSLLF